MMRVAFVLTSLLLTLTVAMAGEGKPSGKALLTPLPDMPLARNFDLPDMDGKRHRLSDYRGRPVIVNFWATWCPPCREELPSMNRAWAQVQKDGIMMLAINVGESEDVIFPFMADYPIDFPVLLDQDGVTIRRWPVRGLPTTFVIDPDGRIVYQAIGGRAWDDPKLLDMVRALKE